VSSALPEGFAVGHWTDSEAATGCTVVLPPPGGAVASGDVRGGGAGTREIELLSPIANAARVHAVLLSGGSAFGLAAADGVMRWLERSGRGYDTPGGLVPLVPGAVVYDLMSGDPARRPGPAEGELACEAATEDPQLGSVGAGTGAAVGKLRGREFAVKTGVGLAKQHLPQGAMLVALAVVNAFGDVIDEGGVLAGPRAEDGEVVSTAGAIASMEHAPDWTRLEERNTTLVCVMTDAALDKPACSRAARMASGGVARAVDPVFSDADGDVAFCLASGDAGTKTDRFTSIAVGTLAATVTAAAIRDAVV
jgi:L-aminopeptidase/D-esterase-like protein